MNAEQPTTLTGHRLTEAEANIREIRSHVATIQTSVGEIAQSMVAMRDRLEDATRETASYRRQSAKDIAGLRDSMADYLPTMQALKAEQERKAERAEKIKTHVIGWGVVTGISSAGYAIFETVRHWLRS